MTDATKLQRLLTEALALANKLAPPVNPGKAKADLNEVCDFVRTLGLPTSDGEACFWKWEGNGWTNGPKPILDWKGTIRSWKAAGYLPSQKGQQQAKPANAVPLCPLTGKPYKTV